MMDEVKEEMSEGVLMAGSEKATLFPFPVPNVHLMHRASDLSTPAEDLMPVYSHTHTYTHHTHSHMINRLGMMDYGAFGDDPPAELN